MRSKRVQWMLSNGRSLTCNNKLQRTFILINLFLFYQTDPLKNIAIPGKQPNLSWQECCYHESCTGKQFRVQLLSLSI